MKVEFQRLVPRCYFVVVTILFSGIPTATAQWYTQYQDLAAINARLDQFADDYPSLVESFVIGQSYEGRDIRGIKISGNGGDRTVRPGVLLNGTQHAREWISPMTNMYAAEQLLSGYGVDDGISELLDGADIYVIPVVNPDGYVYSWTTERNWRKNRRPVGLGEFGVDLNRNWDFGWGLNSGSSPFPGDITYRGPAPFSEPETQAMRDFYYERQNLVANIDFHSYSQLILYPYGYSAVDEPADQVLLQQLAVEMANSMQSVNGVAYDPISASELYLASGISIDWSYGDQSVYSYTIELRPQTFFPGFQLPPQEILPTAAEAFAAVLDLGQFTLTLASGDFNADRLYDCSDIDALSHAILGGTDKYEFDVDGNGSIDTADVAAWLSSAGVRTNDSGGAFLPGDANLDGLVDASDFNVWNQNKFSTGAGWCAGDFNIDGAIDTSDFNIWNNFKFRSSGSIMVPEPTAISLALLGWAIACRRRRICCTGESRTTGTRRIG